MVKGIYVVLFDARVREAYEKLKRGKSEERQLLAYINKAVDELKLNPKCGIFVERKRIPRYYLQRFGKLDELWKYDLPDGWRLIYTVAEEEVKILAIILEWMRHKDYERRFGYRPR